MRELLHVLYKERAETNGVSYTRVHPLSANRRVNMSRVPDQENDARTQVLTLVLILSMKSDETRVCDGCVRSEPRRPQHLVNFYPVFISLARVHKLQSVVIQTPLEVIGIERRWQKLAFHVHNVALLNV